MLDKQSRKVLDSFLALDAQQKDYYDAFFDSEEISKHSGLPEKEIERCFHFLLEEGLIIGLSDQSGHACDFGLTQKGRFYSEFQRIEKLEFFKKSILCPILVSVVTTLITMFLIA